MPSDRLLFVDTNIWLDFYRSQTGAGLSLLERLEGVKDQMIMTYIKLRSNSRATDNVSLQTRIPL
jgi:hypothetical protein